VNSSLWSVYHILFTHLAAEGHLGCSLFGVVMNNVMHIHVQVSVNISLHFSSIDNLGVGLFFWFGFFFPVLRIKPRSSHMLGKHYHWAILKSAEVELLSLEKLLNSFLYFYLFIYLLFVALGFELRASRLLGRHYTAWAILPALFLCWVFLRIGFKSWSTWSLPPE
jgi:hypothetical protein